MHALLLLLEGGSQFGRAGGDDLVRLGDDGFPRLRGGLLDLGKAVLQLLELCRLVSALLLGEL